MGPANLTRCTAFEGTRRVATGNLARVAREAKPVIDAGGSVLIFDDETGETIELDFRGSAEDVLARLAGPGLAGVEMARGRGRPKLGVVAREVTLLPRHWDWLGDQPGGASVALRKLVEEAARASSGRDRARRARDAAYRFLSAVAGNLPDFEEATRAFFAGDAGRFESLTEPWPVDVRDHARKMARAAFEGG